jgi:phosphatidylglycerophosphate synthase
MTEPVAARTGPNNDALPPRTTLEEILNAASDVPNQWYRYPVARGIFLPLAMRTSITPNQTTALHAMVGIVCGIFIARGSTIDLIIAAVLAELRMILDCLDGCVARAKNMLSPMGRTIDEFGDMVGYVGMQVGAAVGLAKMGHSPLWGLAILSPALMAMAYDFYRRKFSSALLENTDGAVDELLRKHREARVSRVSVVMAFGLFFDSLQLAFLGSGFFGSLQRRRLRERLETPESPAKEATEEVRAIRERTSRDPESLRRALTRLSWVTGDNAITVFNLTLLSGTLLAEKLSIAYGVLATLLGAGSSLSFVANARRELRERNAAR